MSQVQQFRVTQPQRPVVGFKAKAEAIPQSILQDIAAPHASQTPSPVKVPAGLQQVYFGALSSEDKAKLQEDILRLVEGSVTKTGFEKMNEVIPTGQEYIKRVLEQPSIVQNSTQRLVDTIESYGKTDTGKTDEDGDKIFSYHIFKGMSGVDYQMHQFVKRLKAASQGGEIGKRLFIFAGPHGTGKSTKINMLIRGLEKYTRSDEGAMFALSWNLPEEIAKEFKLEKNDQGKYVVDELHNDQPLLVIPNDRGQRDAVVKKLNEVYADQKDGQPPYQLKVDGELSPVSELIRQRLMEYYKDKVSNDNELMGKVLNHVQARRLVIDETKRVGVGTYFPKAEKDQDVEELVGGLNYLNVMKYGNVSDPRAQGYDGEFSSANRGILYVEEYFKNKEDLKKLFLTAGQERKFKPSNTAQMSMDAVIIGASNMPEILADMKNDALAAHNSRVEIIADAYVLNYKEEMGIYKNGINKKIKVAPHTLEIASLWSVMTRLGASDIDPLRKALGYAGEYKKADLTPAQVEDEKAKFTENTNEGFDGIDPRFLQNIFSLAPVHSDVEDTKTLTPILTLRMIASALKSRNKFAPNKNLPKYFSLLNLANVELTRRMQQDVMEAFLEDDKLLKTYFLKYLTNVVKWKKGDKPDESFLRAVEKQLKSPVSDAAVVEHRNDLLLKLSVLQEETQSGNLLDVLQQDFNFREALARIVFNDLKNSVDGVEKDRIIKNLERKGYNEPAAREALAHLTTPGGVL